MPPADRFPGWLVVGLGNPDPEYQHTRHNVGFDVADRLARRWDAPLWASRFQGRLASARPDAVEGTVLLLKPMTYMNLSGRAVQGAMTFYRIAPDHVVVVHDDMDLELADVRLKVGGGTAGHRGLESIVAAVGPAFTRVRFGIGRPGRGDAVDHVLTRFDADERRAVDDAIDRAADAVADLLERGAARAMNRINRRAARARRERDEEKT
jgi:PTH1 family peptidyl-tRNA hydrolase